jgi:two-component system sensor histidine kinase MprB
MTISRRLALAAAAAVAVAVMGASVGAYFAVRSKLVGEVDATLGKRVHVVQRLAASADALFGPPLTPLVRTLTPPPQRTDRFGGAAGIGQYVAPNGSVVPLSESHARLPVDALTRKVAAGRAGASFQDETVAGLHLRVLSAPLRGGGAVELARPLDEVESTLNGLILLLGAIAAGGIALAAVLGGVVARTSLAPIRRFTARTEEIAAEHERLGRRLPEEGQDELGRLARSYNSTLAALERSVAAQRQLLSDASHELRTPIASLKANLEVLLQRERLGEDDQRELTGDLVEQLDELTLLVEDVVELARNGEPVPRLQSVRLDEVVSESVQRMGRHAGDAVRFELSVEGPSVVRGEPERLARAVRNLLENAVKWSPPQGVVEVSVRGGTVLVADHGPGIDPSDLPHVFERFYRSAAARSTSGSGLGLAIVKQIAEAHGGSVSAANVPGGGAELRLSLPPAPDPRAASS